MSLKFLPILRVDPFSSGGPTDPCVRELPITLAQPLPSTLLATPIPPTPFRASSDYSLFSRRTGGSGGDGGSSSYLHWKFRSWEEEKRLVKVVTANAREILSFSFLFFFSLISSTFHRASRGVSNCEVRLVIPSAARRGGDTRFSCRQDRQGPTKRRAEYLSSAVALFLPLYCFARAPIAVRISMNIAQSFEKLRYGLYLESLGPFERKTYYRTDKIWMELEQ